ncbi:hypothetical protein GCM10011521_03950 [Arenimonas soli]|uniref:CAAX prenyl protease 2/Lysostaphin resistance protein A-like domain-containing protein n=1 Tax=Arenimonas soli TaxID=2269504 RepID=A0ABQ1HB18_9GAMM|nr:CPBP family intramembrane glutamic endopeptidase [Arenimonas soli]GGA68921.1 hypothetical protein GCM10011521_03950 [Arenimonas soli]
MAPRTALISPAPAFAWLAAWTVLAMLWFVSPAFPMQPLADLQAATGGWLSITLLASGSIGLVQLAILRWPGHQSLAALGWRARDLPPALLLTALLWLLVQGGTLLGAQLADAPLVAHGAWAKGLGFALGPLLAQLLGTALMEETVFRGYLWPQLKARLGGGRRGALVAALLSQALFGLMHVPILAYRGAAPSEIAMAVLGLFLIGLVFVLLYAATRNLFVVVGVHALGNAPTLLFEPQGPGPTMWLLMGSLAVAAVAVVLHRKAKTRLSAGLLSPARGESGGLATNWSGR